MSACGNHNEKRTPVQESLLAPGLAGFHSRRHPQERRTWMAIPALIAECLIRGYQVILSPLLIGTCKFCPTCSEYCAQAVREWGAFRGICLGAKRLLRCHPFTQGGIDPVPKRPA
jgi:putative membrane protein insertion efficiency factor